MEKIEMSPIIFEPYFKTVIWGGHKLLDYKGMSAVASNGEDNRMPDINPESIPECIGESWEISGVPGRESVVAEGAYKGLTITSLVERFGEQFLGSRVVARYGLQFPLLVKFIDAARDLSVQVHPDDKLALKRHNSLGKTEVWYVIKNEPGAKIYTGLKRPITPEEYEQRVADGSFHEILSSTEAKPGDVFFLPPGCVHCIGSGILLAEIQESSDITYRIYDFGRRDADGKLRELHTELAKSAIDYEGKSGYAHSAGELSDREDAEIVKDEHFAVRRIISSGEKRVYPLCRDSLTIIMALDGDLTLEGSWGSTPVKSGHTLLLPAGHDEISVSGTATLLLTQI